MSAMLKQVTMNNKTKMNVTGKTILASALTVACSAASAASFQLIEQSASGQGTSYAGAAAVAEDASTIYFNPAGMTRLSGQQIVVAGHVVSPQADFTNAGSTDAFGQPLQGANSSTGDPALIPNFYYSLQMTDDTFFGVGINVPFGLATEYDDGWVGRYHALNSEISSININPSFAWKATETLSVGFGISLQYVDLSLTNNIDSYAACVNLASQSGGAFTGPDCALAGMVEFGDAATDSHVKLEGDSVEIGWNAGIMLDLKDNSRMGIAYRSAIKHNVEGDSTYALYQGLQPFADNFTAASGFNVLQSGALEATAELPDSFSVSFAGEINDKWTALVDWTWTGWGKLDVITIRQAGGVPGQEPTLELNYRNTNRYSLGALYHHTDKLVYRGGIAYDETPIRSPESTSARIPGNNRTWLSFGAGYDISDKWTVDVGYSHLFISDTEINNGGASSSNATLVGSYESSVDIFSAQAVLNF